MYEGSRDDPRDAGSGTRIRFADWTLDLETRELRRNGRPVPLRRQLRALLCHLARNRHRVVTRDELLREIWRGLHVTPDAISQAVKDLRRALGDDGARQAVIRTERGRGYRFSSAAAGPHVGPDGGAPDRLRRAGSG